MIRSIRNKSFLWLILLLALLLRLIAINQSLWLDEAIGALVVKEQTFNQIATQFPKSDNHPPLYYLLLKGWTNIFGYSELALRLPSVIFGVLTVYAIYLIASRLVGYELRVTSSRNSTRNPLTQKAITYPTLAALLLATSPFHIYYSQEARMYIMAGFFASLAVYSFLFLLEKSSKTRVQPLYWLLFSFSIAALIFTDYVPLFLLPIFWIYTFSKKMSCGWWTRFLLSHLPIVVLGVAWLPMFLYQAERGRWLLTTLPGWGNIAGGATFKQAALVWMKFVLGRITFADKIFYYSLVILASIPFLLTGVKAWLARKKVGIVWLWLTVPLALGFLISFVFPAFIYFRFVYVVPAFYLICAWGVKQARTGLSKSALVVALLAVNMVGWLIYASEPYQQREHWRQAVDFVESKANEKDGVIFEFPEPFAPYKWYAEEEVEAIGATDSISANEVETLEKTQDAVVDKVGVYYFEYLRDLTDPNRLVERALADSGFVIDEIYDFFPGVGQITYFVKE